MKAGDKRVKQAFVIGAVVIGFLGVYALGSPLIGNLVKIGPKEPTDMGSFAQCLTEKGAVMYGLGTCGHCNQQKELFGESFQYIDYVECSVYQDVCMDDGVTHVPAWKVGEDLELGAKTFEELSEMYGCPLE